MSQVQKAISSIISRYTLAIVLISSASGIGCGSTLAALPYFLFAGTQAIPPAVKLVKKKRDKKKIVVLSYANSGLQWGYDQIDDDITNLVISEIAQKENRLEVIPERKVRAWKDLNPDWMDKSLQEVGEHFDVDFVVFIEAADFTINEGKNQFLLKGKTRVILKVHDVNKDLDIHDHEYHRDYPRDRSVPINDVASENSFKTTFMQRIARELSWQIIPHYKEDEFDE